jgi:hypothetical protein
LNQTALDLNDSSLLDSNGFPGLAYKRNIYNNATQNGNATQIDLNKRPEYYRGRLVELHKAHTLLNDGEINKFVNEELDIIGQRFKDVKENMEKKAEEKGQKSDVYRLSDYSSVNRGLKSIDELRMETQGRSNIFMKNYWIKKIDDFYDTLEPHINNLPKIGGRRRKSTKRRKSNRRRKSNKRRKTNRRN